MNPISSKRGLHSIESSIAVETKILSLMRRLKDLEAKEPAPRTMSAHPKSNFGLYLLSSNIFLAQQILPEYMNVAFSRPHKNPYSQTYNPDWRNYPNFSWSQDNHNHPRSNFSNHFQAPNFNQNIPIQVPYSSFQNPLAKKTLTDLEKRMETLIKSQTSFMQNTG